jgi:arylsulfatase
MISRRELLAAPSLLQRVPSRPNILFLMADQHRADCWGGTAHTPHLSRLAREGATFVNAYSCTPTCTPARACLLTGLAPWNHGMLAYGRVAPKYAYEMPTALNGLGYFTAAIGKLHYSPQRNVHGYRMALLDESGRVESVDFRSDYRSWFASQAPLLNPDATGVGFNDYNAKAYVLPERLHPTRWTADCAVRFLEDYQRPDPFFLKVSFARPHSPYDPPQRWMDFYKGRQLPPPAVGDWAAENRSRNTENNDLWRGDLGTKAAAESRQGYWGSVSFVDEQIGRILEALEKRGMLENTLIVYTSDHGDMLGDHHLWRKSYAYEGSTRIPMIVRQPGATKGQTVTQPVELRDLFPTFLDAAGAQPARPLDGRSMLPLLRGKSEGWREWIDLEHGVCYDPSNQWTALTNGQWKYIFHALTGTEQLFDLRSDRSETLDQSGNAAELRLWRGRMVQHLEGRGEAWVKQGKLARREKFIQYSPNYPRGA